MMSASPHSPRLALPAAVFTARSGRRSLSHRRKAPSIHVSLALLLLGGVCGTANAQYKTLPGPAGASSASASGISNGTIVGAYVDGFGNEYGYSYNGTTYTIINNPLGTQGTFVSGISGSTIVGAYTDDNGQDHGFTYNGGTFTSLPDAPGAQYTDPLAISGSTIVGSYYGGGFHGFSFDGTTYTTLDDPSLGTTETLATGVSGNDIVGYYGNNQTGLHGFIYNGTTYTTVDDPNGGNTVLEGISGNTIVGTYENGGVRHGFTYNGSTFTNLPDPVVGAGSIIPEGISGNTIVGTYYDSHNIDHTFSYTDTNITATTPEPGSAALLLGMSVVGVGFMARRRARRK